MSIPKYRNFPKVSNFITKANISWLLWSSSMRKSSSRKNYWMTLERETRISNQSMQNSWSTLETATFAKRIMKRLWNTTRRKFRILKLTKNCLAKNSIIWVVAMLILSKINNRLNVLMKPSRSMLSIRS